jgi:uncharacterized membrane protein YphA (DoxX/SURF4 family)
MPAAKSNHFIGPLMALAGLQLTLSPVASAHEKWFYDASRYPAHWGEVFRFPTNVLALAAILATSVLWFWSRTRNGWDLIPGPGALGATESSLAKFYGIVPLILGIHVGLPLIVLGIKGELFSPNNQLTGAWFFLLGVAQIGIGLCFLYGAMTRLAALVLGALWLVGIGVVGLESMLENLQYLGVSAFFFLTGRGPYAIDRLLYPALEPSPRFAIRAMWSLRIATGLGLTFVAFTEKLANPALANAFLQQYPLNFTSWLHIPIPDDVFIRCAGATELLIGLCLAFGIFARVIIATAWILINMTLTIFNWTELVGHLPLYGIMAMLLVWTPRAEDERLWIQGVLPSTPD